MSAEGWRYGFNAARMWASLGPERSEVLEETPEYSLLRMLGSGTLRLLIRREVAKPPPELVKWLSSGKRAFVEDPFGRLELPGHLGFESSGLPIMIRPAGKTEPTFQPQGLRVSTVQDASTLAEAERVIVESYPLPALQPFVAGAALPPTVLTTPGWNVWVAHLEGRAACACFTHDDGTSLGLYWLATRQEARLSGLGRAVMTAALNAHPDRDAVLVSSEAGHHLYTALGFRSLSPGTLHVRRG